MAPGRIMRSIARERTTSFRNLSDLEPMLSISREHLSARLDPVVRGDGG
jgi:hypothetical protein